MCYTARTLSYKGIQIQPSYKYYYNQGWVLTKKKKIQIRCKKSINVHTNSTYKFIILHIKQCVTDKKKKRYNGNCPTLLKSTSPHASFISLWLLVAKKMVNTFITNGQILYSQFLWISQNETFYLIDHLLLSTW